jgi:hypothetical protein
MHLVQEYGAITTTEVLQAIYDRHLIDPSMSGDNRILIFIFVTNLGNHKDQVLDLIKQFPKNCEFAMIRAVKDRNPDSAIATLNLIKESQIFTIENTSGELKDLHRPILNLVHCITTLVAQNRRDAVISTAEQTTGLSLIEKLSFFEGME